MERCLAPWAALGQDFLRVADSGSEASCPSCLSCLCDATGTSRLCSGNKEDSAVAQPHQVARVELVPHVGELACLSALLSTIGSLPAAPGLVLASANLGTLGTFTSASYALSVLAASFLTMTIPVILGKHPEIEQRKPFRVVSGAVAAAAVGQISFMMLSLTPGVALLNMLPGVAVSDFIMRMQHPFMVVYLVCHSVQLPMMSLVLGRLAGRSCSDMSTCHYCLVLYSSSVVLSAATQEPYLRWPLLAAGSLFLKRGLAEIEGSSRFVETIAPCNPFLHTWTQNHRICVGFFVSQASLHPMIQSMGYLEWISMVTVHGTWTLLSVFLTAGIAMLSLKEGAHVGKSEEFMGRKERGEHLHVIYGGRP